MTKNHHHATISHIANKPAEQRTPAEQEKLRVYWATKKRTQRSGSGLFPAVNPLSDVVAKLGEYLRAHGTAVVVRQLELAMLVRAGEEPQARVRELLLEETRHISRLVGTLTPEPTITTPAPKRASGART